MLFTSILLATLSMAQVPQYPASDKCPAGTQRKSVCPSGKVEGAGLCYTPCAEGWAGRGPICWKGIKSYGRGVGVLKIDTCAK